MTARKVLLMAEGCSLHKESLMCAVNLCKRTSATLLVVNVVDCPKEHTYWVDVHRRLVRERLEEAARNIDPLLDEARAQGVAVELVRQVGQMDAVLKELAASSANPLVAVAGQIEPETGVPDAAAQSACAASLRRLVERIEALFGCPFVAVKARK